MKEETKTIHCQVASTSILLSSRFDVLGNRLLMCSFRLTVVRPLDPYAFGVLVEKVIWVLDFPTHFAEIFLDPINALLLRLAELCQEPL